MVNYGHNMGSLKNSTFFTRFLSAEFEKNRGPSQFPRVLKAWSPDHPTQSEAFIFFAINCKFERDQFIKMWNGVQVHGFLIKVKHAVGDEEWQRRSKKAEAELAELTKKVEKVEELRSAVEEAKTENLYGKLEEEKSLHSQAAPKLQELDAMEEQLRELQGAKEREERSPVL